MSNEKNFSRILAEDIVDSLNMPEELQDNAVLLTQLKVKTALLVSKNKFLKPQRYWKYIVVNILIYGILCGLIFTELSVTLTIVLGIAGVNAISTLITNWVFILPQKWDPEIIVIPPRGAPKNSNIS